MQLPQLPSTLRSQPLSEVKVKLLINTVVIHNIEAIIKEKIITILAFPIIQGLPWSQVGKTCQIITAEEVVNLVAV